jgi:hypothetical protein
VLAHLAKLEEAGLIVRIAQFADGRQIHNRYWMPASPDDAPPPIAAGVRYLDRGRVQQMDGAVPVPEGGSPAGGPTGVPQLDTEPSVRTPIEPNNNSEPRASVASVALAVLGNGNGASGSAVRVATRAERPLPGLAADRTSQAIVKQLAQVLDEVRSGARERLSREQRQTLQARTVFAYWIHKFDHPRALLDDRRERVIVKRLEENDGDVSELLYALDGARNDGWVMGTAQGCDHKNDGIEYILRDRARVERYANDRKHYRDGAPHAMAAKYAAIIAGENGRESGGESAGADTPPVVVVDPAGAGGGSDDRQHERHEQHEQHRNGRGDA